MTSSGNRKPRVAWQPSDTLAPQVKLTKIQEGDRGAGEMLVQWFRAFSALAEDLDSIPRTHMG